MITPNPLSRFISSGPQIPSPHLRFSVWIRVELPPELKSEAEAATQIKSDQLRSLWPPRRLLCSTWIVFVFLIRMVIGSLSHSLIHLYAYDEVSIPRFLPRRVCIVINILFLSSSKGQQRFSHDSTASSYSTTISKQASNSQQQTKRGVSFTHCLLAPIYLMLVAGGIGNI